MKKVVLARKIPEIILSDTQQSILKQHEQTYNRAKVGGSGICVIGPFTRTDFPLLKLEQKDKEYFVRVDQFMVNRYYIDEYKNQIRETYFYPHAKLISDFENMRKTGKGVNDGLFMLYNKLVSDGMGSSYIRNIPKGKVELKKKSPGKLRLKRKTERIRLKRL